MTTGKKGGRVSPFYSVRSHFPLVATAFRFISAVLHREPVNKVWLAEAPSPRSEQPIVLLPQHQLAIAINGDEAPATRVTTYPSSE